MNYIIKEMAEGVTAGFAPRGAHKLLWKCKALEAMDSGPAETGKTFAALQKLDALMWKYSGAQSVIIRKSYSTMKGSVLASYENKILKNSPVKPFGGSMPQWYDYPNGSRVWIAGMDNPDKALSSERDLIYVNQAEELTLDAWETLATRATGRAGNMPYAQLMGDCNPQHAGHWIKHRQTFKDYHSFFESRHEDNPTLFDNDGDITPQGVISLRVLDSLTGVRLQRLRYGKWASAEGVIYDGFDSATHVIKRADVPTAARTFWSVDFGYTHPFVWQNWTVDYDGRLYLTQEIYKTQRIVEDHAADILRITQGQPKPEAIICDHDAEDRATLERHLGMRTVGAIKNVSAGIQAVQARLKIAGDGKARIYFVEDALVETSQALKELRQPISTIEEFDSYIWNDKKDEPVKANDHGLDTARYMAAQLDLYNKVGHGESIPYN